MRIVAVLFASSLLLAGCIDAPVPRVVDPPPRMADASVLVSDAEVLVPETLARYIDITNDIIDGADPAQISDVTTPEWAAEELRGFLAVKAMGGDVPHASVSRMEIESIHGKHVLVAAQVAACMGGGDVVTRVTVHLVPRATELVVSEIVPWEDATWCTESSAD